MRIVISGSTGLIGSALVSRLEASGDEVVRLIRPQTRGAREGVLWEPEARRIDAASLEGADAVVHLAGESIAGRWTAAKKERIRRSRVEGTLLIAETLAALARPPRALASASAIGYYGDTGAEVVREDAPAGRDFLAEVCRAWEAAAEPAARAGLRVANLRFGMVLSGRGGALRQMLPPFRLGVGGRLGSGAQYMSWVALDDVARAIRHVLDQGSLAGPVNVVAPRSVTNAEFTRALGRALGRPTFLPVPAFAARLAFGELAQVLLLSGQRVEPAQLLASGFKFDHPEIEGALRYALGELG